MTQTQVGPRPRDDRMWPRGAVPFSVAVVVAALASLIVLTATAQGSTRAFVGIGFVAVAAVEATVYLAAMRRVLAGLSVPAWSHLAQLGLVVVAYIVLQTVDSGVGLAMLAGLFGGMFAANLWSIRAARSNRARVDAVEAELARQRAERDERDHRAPPARHYADRDVPAVGVQLRTNLGVTLRNWLAWLVAGVVVLMACVALAAPEAAVLAVLLVGGAALLWVARRLVAAWLAKLDFDRCATEPRRAYVVLLHDPTPRVIRPLLGVWPEEPVAGPGRLPKPERVYRCDDEVDALECYQGAVVVHEAWVDTGRRAWSKPRWVAADQGIALPHRRAILGRWFMSNLIGAERPEPARPLTMPAPRPGTETIAEVSPDVGSFPAKVAWRLAVLGALALVLVLLT